MTDIDQLIERIEENVAEVPDTYWPGHMKEYARDAAQALRLLNDVYEAAKGVSWPGPMLEKAIAAAQEKVDE